MNLRIFTLTALAAIARPSLAGCAGTVWTKPGATSQQFSADRYSLMSLERPRRRARRPGL